MSARQFRILFVLTPALHPNSGGVQMSTTKLGRHFSELGHDVGVFSFATEGHAACEFGNLFAACEPGGHNCPENKRALEKILEGFSPDIVINQMPYEHAVGEVLALNKRYLLLGCLRNTLFSVKGNLDAYIRRSVPRKFAAMFLNPIGKSLFLAGHRRRHKSDLKNILSTYDRFIMFGPPNLDELSWFVPDFDREKIALIPNSIPEVSSRPLKKEKRILWVGRLDHEQKRAELILPLWQKVSQALPDWKLDVVGDGPLLPELKQQAARENLPRIDFHGRQVPDDYYRRAAIFFMTSAFEGFPNTLVEAQSFGAIPVVFDSYPMARWIVKDGESGFLIQPFDVDAMAERIVTLANDPGQSKCAEGALESARRFHIDRVGEMWRHLFEEALAGSSDRRDSSVSARS